MIRERERGRLSRRTAAVRPLALARLLAAVPGTDTIDLALGIPPAAPPAPIVEGAVESLRGGWHQYTDAAGLPDLRRMIADELYRSRGVVVDPEHEVTITCGSTEGAMCALIAVTDPGDEVIVFEPFFENHPGAVELVGAVPTYVPLTRPGWRMDLDAVRRAVTTRTRAILFSTPHNPTGRVFDADEIGGLLDLCAEFDIVCITDEVYEQYVYDGLRHVSPLQAGRPRRHSIMLGSLSKSLQISGWRVGYCVAEPELSEGVRRVHTRTTLGAATPLQHGIVAGLPHVTATDTGSRERFQQRRDQLSDGLEALGLELVRPEGGWFLLAGVDRLGWMSDELVSKLAREAGVLLAPGTAFFADPADGAGWVRVTLVRDAQRTSQALDRLHRFFSAH